MSHKKARYHMSHLPSVVAAAWTSSYYCLNKQNSHLCIKSSELSCAYKKLFKIILINNFDANCDPCGANLSDTMLLAAAERHSACLSGSGADRPSST